MSWLSLLLLALQGAPPPPLILFITNLFLDSALSS